jgi:hypothetical protein
VRAPLILKDYQVSSIGHPMVSNVRRLQLHYPLLETERHGMVIVNFPGPFCGISFAALIVVRSETRAMLKFLLR